MVDKVKFSIVVPVYNVEKYLPNCIRSLLEQKEYDNYEILLIDDGSTDGSSKLCDNYAEVSEKIFAYHKPNGGLSDARNYGLIRTSGDYVFL